MVEEEEIEKLNLLNYIPVAQLKIHVQRHQFISIV